MWPGSKSKVKGLPFIMRPSFSLKACKPKLNLLVKYKKYTVKVALGWVTSILLLEWINLQPDFIKLMVFQLPFICSNPTKQIPDLCEKYLYNKFTIKAPKQRRLFCSGVFLVNLLSDFSHLTLNIIYLIH